MRIVFETHGTDKFGGAERRLLRIHERLAAVHEVHLLVHGCSREDFECGARRCGVTLDWAASVTCLRGAVLLQAVDAAAYFRRIRPTITHCFDASRFNYVLSLLPQHIRGKLLLTMAYGLYGDGIPSNTDRLLELLLPRVDWVDLLYPWQTSRYSALVRDSAQITVTPSSFTDLEAIHPRIKENLIVMFSARLEEFKGVDLLVEACELCADELLRYKYTVAICGAGERLSILQEEIDSRGLGDVVQLMGYQDPRDWFPRAAVACNVPPVVSNYPSQTLIEAAACGCYCVVSNTPHSELMIDPSFSALVNPSPQEIADALVGYIQMSPHEKDMIISNARKFAETHFSIDASVVYFEEIFKRLAY